MKAIRQDFLLTTHHINKNDELYGTLYRYKCPHRFDVKDAEKAISKPWNQRLILDGTIASGHKVTKHNWGTINFTETDVYPN